MFCCATKANLYNLSATLPYILITTVWGGGTDSFGYLREELMYFH